MGLIPVPNGHFVVGAIKIANELHQEMHNKQRCCHATRLGLESCVHNRKTWAAACLHGLALANNAVALATGHLKGSEAIFILMPTFHH